MFLNIDLRISGFHILTRELSHGVSFWKLGYSKERLQQMFPMLTEEEEDGLKSLAESYHKYKREYVKHLGFNPEEENLSSHNLNSQYPFAFSFYAGACAA